jgi:hypothetical protein
MTIGDRVIEEQATCTVSHVAKADDEPAVVPDLSSRSIVASWLRYGHLGEQCPLWIGSGH